MIEKITSKTILAITELEACLCNLVNGYADTPELKPELQKKWLDREIERLTEAYEKAHNTYGIFSSYDAELRGLIPPKEQMNLLPDAVSIEEKAQYINEHDALDPMYQKIYRSNKKISKSKIDEFRRDVARARMVRVRQGYKNYA